MNRNENYLNETEIRKAITQLKDPGQIFECRIISPSQRLSGYFRDADTLIKAFEPISLRDANVYITLQNVKTECFSRKQSEHFERVKGDATSDNDVEGYQWLFIDMDPERSSGISSSNEELKTSYAVAKTVYEYLRDLGFEEPVKAISGNGSHLLYKIGLIKSDENTQLVKRCLEVLDTLFSNDQCHIDTVNYNASRICKLYGTLAQKGTSTEDRPHRFAKIIGNAKQCETTPKALLEKLAGQVEQDPVQPTPYNSYQSTFDAVTWMDEHGIEYEPPRPIAGGVKYILKQCPFNSSHLAPDSMVTVADNGMIGFKCLHNSCKDKHWKDLRLLYEPTAYSQSVAGKRDDEIERGWKEHRNALREDLTYEPISVTEPTAPMFETAMDIINKPTPEREFIRTGIEELDLGLKGLEKTCVSCVTGLSGASKSTLLSQVMLTAINDNQTVLCYSGELSDRQLIRWMILQAAGKAWVKKSEKYRDEFTVEPSLERKIAEWMDHHFYLYNNDYGNKFEKLEYVLTKQAKKVHADLIVIDNLMALDLPGNQADKYEAQTNFVWSLKNLAKLSNTSIVFVAHPRKSNGFLRMSDISGSANIFNICDNVFLVHRCNHDFEKLFTQEFGKEKFKELYDGSNCIEVAKNRDTGAQDMFIPLYYEISTKRLKNDPIEYIHYSWEDMDDTGRSS